MFKETLRCVCGCIKEHAKKVVGIAAGAAVGMKAAIANAALTVPELPITDLETAGGTVLGFVAVFVLIVGVIRMFKRA